MKITQLLCLFICLSVMFSPHTSYADIVDVEMAVLRGDYDQVKRLAEEIVYDPEDSSSVHEAQYYVGLSSIYLSEYKLAQKNLEKLSKQRLSRSLKQKVSLALIDAYFLDGDYTKAHKMSRKLLKKSADSPFLSLIYLKVAKASLKLAYWAEARGFLKQIINNFPDSLEVPIARQLLEEKQYFAVQVGAFMERRRAEELVFELKLDDEYAYIVETKNNQDQKFYRVRVGQLALLSDAQKLKDKLSQRGYPARIFP